MLLNMWKMVYEMSAGAIAPAATGTRTYVLAEVEGRAFRATGTRITNINHLAFTDTLDWPAQKRLGRYNTDEVLHNCTTDFRRVSYLSAPTIEFALECLTSTKSTEYRALGSLEKAGMLVTREDDVLEPTPRAFAIYTGCRAVELNVVNIERRIADVSTDIRHRSANLKAAIKEFQQFCQNTVIFLDTMTTRRTFVRAAEVCRPLMLPRTINKRTLVNRQCSNCNDLLEV